MGVLGESPGRYHLEVLPEGGPLEGFHQGGPIMVSPVVGPLGLVAWGGSLVVCLLKIVP
jgi:hypothetical protein